MMAICGAGIFIPSNDELTDDEERAKDVRLGTGG
jgi:hypothetical protein